MKSNVILQFIMMNFIYNFVLLLICTLNILNQTYCYASNEMYVLANILHNH